MPVKSDPEPIGIPYKRRGKYMVLCRIKTQKLIPRMSLDHTTVIGWTTFHDWIVKDLPVSSLPEAVQKELVIT